MKAVNADNVLVTVSEDDRDKKKMCPCGNVRVCLIDNKTGYEMENGPFRCSECEPLMDGKYKCIINNCGCIHEYKNGIVEKLAGDQPCWGSVDKNVLFYFVGTGAIEYIGG